MPDSNNHVIEVPAVELKLETYRAGIKNRSRKPSKGKFKTEETRGDDWSYSLGRWVKNHRIIDRDSDTYYELVFDEDTGDIIRECKEKLSEHTGRGKAKNK